MRNMLRGVILLMLIALGGWALAACGDDADDNGNAPRPATQAPAALSVSDPAPPFSLPTASGETVSLADYQGAPVLLFFHMAGG